MNAAIAYSFSRGGIVRESTSAIAANITSQRSRKIVSSTSSLEEK